MTEEVVIARSCAICAASRGGFRPAPPNAPRRAGGAICGPCDQRVMRGSYVDPTDAEMLVLRLQARLFRKTGEEFDRAEKDKRIVANYEDY